VYKRQIYQIVESNRIEKIDSVARIESNRNFFCPNWNALWEMLLAASASVSVCHMVYKRKWLELLTPNSLIIIIVSSPSAIWRTLMRSIQLMVWATLLESQRHRLSESVDLRVDTTKHFFPVPSITFILPDRQIFCWIYILSRCMCKQGGSVAEWLACWTQAQKGLGSNPSRDVVG